MKKFSRMPKSESGSLGGGSGSGTGSSNYIGKVFAIGRYQVTVEELIAEGNGSICLGHTYNEVAKLTGEVYKSPPIHRAISSSGRLTLYQVKHTVTTGCTSSYPCFGF